MNSMENVETGVNVITLCFTKVSGILLFSRDPKKKAFASLQRPRLTLATLYQ